MVNWPTVTRRVSRSCSRIVMRAEYDEVVLEDSAALSANREARVLTWDASACSVSIFFLSCASRIAPLAFELASSISSFAICVVESFSSLLFSASRTAIRLVAAPNLLEAVVLSPSMTVSLLSSSATMFFRLRFSLVRTLSVSSLEIVTSRRLASSVAILVARKRSVSLRLLSCASRELTWSTKTWLVSCVLDNSDSSSCTLSSSSIRVPSVSFLIVSIWCWC
mmetsp:Transcript_34434/g.48904  ORF Transcript_34434/g.48904 Transcript_34434/m.48904 type:complete len:223 (-) Transcript_34434:588-1256(-)